MEQYFSSNTRFQTQTQPGIGHPLLRSIFLVLLTLVLLTQAGCGGFYTNPRYQEGLVKNPEYVPRTFGRPNDSEVVDSSKKSPENPGWFSLSVGVRQEMQKLGPLPGWFLSALMRAEGLTLRF